VHIPTKRSDPYELLVCPWDAIEMIKTVDVAHAVAQKGGPDDYLRENWGRVVEPAIRMAELAATNS
jgi:electron transport complex protein RnfB